MGGRRIRDGRMDWDRGLWTRRRRISGGRAHGVAEPRSFGRRAPEDRDAVNPPVLLTSIPKAGTHLLRPVLCEILGRRSIAVHKSAYGDLRFARTMNGRSVYYGHLRSDFAPWSSPKAAVIVLLRDPRDLLVSLRDFILRGGAQPAHRMLADAFRTMALDDQYRRIIDGVRFQAFGPPPPGRKWIVAPLTKHCAGFAEWGQLGATVIRYEDLFTDAAPGQLVQALSWSSMREADARRALQRWIGQSTATFNIGRPGRWREALSPQVLDHLAARAPELLPSLGYD
jgi:hypothetical protein